MILLLAIIYIFRRRQRHNLPHLAQIIEPLPLTTSTVSRTLFLESSAVPLYQVTTTRQSNPLPQRAPIREKARRLMNRIQEDLESASGRDPSSSRSRDRSGQDEARRGQMDSLQAEIARLQHTMQVQQEAMHNGMSEPPEYRSNYDVGE